MGLFQYKGSKVWTYEFVFQGQRIRESTGTRSKTLARDIEKARRRALEEGTAGIKKPAGPSLFVTASETWLEIKEMALAPSTIIIEKNNLRHLLLVFGKTLVSDIQAVDVARYQKKRRAAGASPKTVNLEIGTFRSIMRRAKQWERLREEVSMLTVDEEVGRAITADEDTALTYACSQSRSRVLLPFVTLAMETAARRGVIKILRWRHVSFEEREIRWGKDKTPAGTGRLIPLSTRALQTLQLWAENFPDRHPDHFVFPTEKYAAAGHKFGKTGAKVKEIRYDSDPTKPMGSIKEGWEEAKKRAGKAMGLKDAAGNPLPLQCRFHDLRHTAVTRMLKAGVPISVIAKIAGWSVSTQVKMTRLYGHLEMSDMRLAVEKISGESPVNSPVSRSEESRNKPN